jgi:hypothetical protein
MGINLEMLPWCLGERQALLVSICSQQYADDQPAIALTTHQLVSTYILLVQTY